MIRKTLAVLSLLLISANVFADTVGSVLLPNSTVSNACTIDYIGTYEDTSYMVPVYEDIIYSCNPGYYLPADSEKCRICPEDHYCTGGSYIYSETESQGIKDCPGELLAPQGMHEEASCGRILHIGNELLYLRSTKKTTPSLNIDIDNDGIPDFFGNITYADIPMNRNTERKLKLQYNGQTVSVYDDSIEVDELPSPKEEKEQ